MRTVRRTSCRASIALAAVLFAAALSFGEDDPARNKLGLTFGAGLPMGAFRTNLGQDGGQIALYYARRLKNTPLYIGFDLSLLIYGMSTRQENLSNIPEAVVDVETDNNIVQGLFFVRCQPDKGRFRPYIEALAGVSYLYTDTSISNHDLFSDEITSHTNFSDFALAAGGGAGVDIHLGGGRLTAHGKRTTEWVLDVKACYLAGTRAKYLKEGSIVYAGGQAVYLYQESSTHLLSVQVGIATRF